MNNIQASAILKIHDGKLKEFKEVANQCIESIKASEPGTTQFDLFFNADETECVIKEDYRDSAAMFIHLGNLGALLGRMLQISDMTLEIYGNPSEELRARIAAANPKIYSFYRGL
jgi:quinol monooxygenase YgiN